MIIDNNVSQESRQSLTCQKEISRIFISNAPFLTAVITNVIKVVVIDSKLLFYTESYILYFWNVCLLLAEVKTWYLGFFCVPFVCEFEVLQNKCVKHYILSIGNI